MSAALTMPTAPTSILDLADGLHTDFPESMYHARIPGVASKSVLELVDRAPAIYAEWLKGAERDETEALAFGKAFHCALLEPDVYDRRYVVEPEFGDCRKTDNKKRRDEWRLASTGRIPIDQADAMAILGMVRSLRENKQASKMLDLDEGISELTMKWTDPETGLVCKGRADRYVDRLDTCFDIKTTDDARANVFLRSVANYGYHKQNAFYDDGFRAVGAPLNEFVFIAVEKRAPYLVGIFNLDDDAIGRGREWTRRTLDRLAECIERGEYPGYPTSIQTLSLPAWA